MDDDNVSKLPATKAETSVTSLSPLQLYLKEIAKYPLLNPDEEFEEARKHFEENDLQAAHRLITSNLRLVVKIANDFRRAQGSILDLIQEGNYGLMQAVKKFNPYKGVRLSSYAAWWIRAYILKYLMDHKSQVKIATTAAQRKLFYNLQKETDRLLAEYDSVDPKLIAKALNVSEKDVIEMQKRLGTSDVSLDAPLSVEASSSSDKVLRKQDTFVDERSSSVEDTLADQQLKDMFLAHLDEFVATLKGRDLEIFHSRLMSETPLTLQEVGDRYGITRERARQIESRILTKLRQFAAKKGILD